MCAAPLSLAATTPWVKLLIGTGVSTLRDCFIIVIRHFTTDLKVSIVPGAYPQLLATFGGESGAAPTRATVATPDLSTP